MDGFGGLGLADFGRADFVGGGVAGTLEGAPHVPTGDSAVGAPAFAEGEEFLGLGHVFFAVGDGPAFLDAEVVDGKDIGAAEAEDQKHFDGPSADAANGDEALDEFFVGKPLGLFQSGDDAVDGFLREVLHGQGFGTGESGFAKDGFAELQHFLGSGGAAGGAEGFDATVDGGGSFAGDGLVGDGFEKGFVRRLEGILVHLEGDSFCDQPLQTFVALSEMLGGCG